MKKILILSVSLFFIGLSMMTVHAEEAQKNSEPVVSEYAGADKAVAEETSAEREAFAKSLFEGRCQMCHQLPEPGMLRPKQWQLILETMQQRMQQAKVPPLTDDETERLLEYLSARAR